MHSSFKDSEKNDNYPLIICKVTKANFEQAKYGDLQLFSIDNSLS